MQNAAACVFFNLPTCEGLICKTLLLVIHKAKQLRAVLR